MYRKVWTHCSLRLRTVHFRPRDACVPDNSTWHHYSHHHRLVSSFITIRRKRKWGLSYFMVTSTSASQSPGLLGSGNPDIQGRAVSFGTMPTTSESLLACWVTALLRKSCFPVHALRFRQLYHPDITCEHIFPHIEQLHHHKAYSFTSPDISIGLDIHHSQSLVILMPIRLALADRQSARHQVLSHNH